MNDEAKTQNSQNQDDQDNLSLEEKRKRAAMAMSGGRSVVDPLKSIEEEKAKRKEAESIKILESVKSPQVDSMELAKRRLEAKMAMEGAQRKKQREEEEERERLAEEQKVRELQKQKEEQMRREMREREEAVNLQIQKSKQEETKKQTQETFEEIVRSGSGISSVRTLKLDLDTHIKEKNISGISAAVMEDQKRRQKQAQESDVLITEEAKSKKVVKLAFIFIAVAIGSGVVFYNRQNISNYISYIIGQEDGVTGEDQKNLLEPIIFVETSKTLDITGKTSREALAMVRSEVKDADLRIGAIESVLLSKNGKILSGFSDFYSALNISVPDALSRLVDDHFTFGLYSSIENGGFIILKTKFLEKAYAELLAWEGESMAQDILPVLSPKAVTDEIIRQQFTDELIKNINTRILKDKNGEVYMIYAFLDKDILVMSGNRPTFLEVLRRYNTPKPISN